MSLQSLGQHEEALLRCREAATLRPDSVEVQVNLGHILQSLGRHAEACKAFATVLALDARRIEMAPYLLHSRLHLCDWHDLDGLTQTTMAAAARGDGSESGATVPPFALASTPATLALRLQAARHSAAAHARAALLSAAARRGKKPSPHRLRVARFPCP